LLLTKIPEKLSAFMSVTVIAKAQKAFGNHCRQYIGSVPSLTQIFGQPMMIFSRKHGIKALEKKPGKPTISSVSTLRSGKGFLGWCAKHCHFPRNWKIT
jgi:hypothetical protein